MPHNPILENKQQEYVENGVRLVQLIHQGSQWRLGATSPNWRAQLTHLPQNPDADTLRALNVHGVWLAQEKENKPRVAVTCCGQGSVWMHMGRALYDTFPAARDAMDTIAAAADWDILALMDETNNDIISDTRWQQPYIFLIEYAQYKYLESLGFEPNVLSGHSLGELVALCLARVYSPAKSFEIFDRHAIVLDDLRKNYTHDTGMMAVYNFHDNIQGVLEAFPELAVSNYNSPSQYILSGPKEVIVEARRSLRKKKVAAITLNVDMAFHHKSMRVIRDTVVGGLLEIPSTPPYIPMLSNATGLPYPHEHEGICNSIADLDENAVRWVDCVRYMWEKEHVRHFIELGPANTISGLTQEIQPDALCIATSAKNKEVEAMRAAVAQLYSLGHIGTRGLYTVHADIKTEDDNAHKENIAEQTNNTPHIPPYVQDILPILAEATGFAEKDLRPDMDLRLELSLRSSRFPSIMYKLEKAFDIDLQFEDLIEVSTVGDLANVVSQLRLKDKDNAHKDIANNDGVNIDSTRTNEVAVNETAAPTHSHNIVRARPVMHTFSMPAAEPVTYADNTLLPALIVGTGAHAQIWKDILLPIGGAERVRFVEDSHNAFMFMSQGFHPALLVFTSEERQKSIKSTATTDAAVGAGTTAEKCADATQDSPAPKHDSLRDIELALRLVTAFAHSPRAHLCIAHHAPQTHQVSAAGQAPGTYLSSSPLFASLRAYLGELDGNNTNKNSDSIMRSKILTHDAHMSHEVLTACVRRLLLSDMVAQPHIVHIARAHMQSVRLEPCPWNEPLTTTYTQGLVRPKDTVIIYAQDASFLEACVRTCAMQACDMAIICAEEYNLDAEVRDFVTRMGACITRESVLAQNLDAVQDASSAACDFISAFTDDLLSCWERVDAVMLVPTMQSHIGAAPASAPMYAEAVLRMLTCVKSVRSVLALSSCSGLQDTSPFWPALRALSFEQGFLAHNWHDVHMVHVSDKAVFLHPQVFAFALAHECFGMPTSARYWLSYPPESTPTCVSFHQGTAIDAVSRGTHTPFIENPETFPRIYPQTLILRPNPHLQALCHFSFFGDARIREYERVTEDILLEYLTQGARLLYPWLSVHSTGDTVFATGSADIVCTEGMTREGRLSVTAYGWRATHCMCAARLEIRQITENGRRTDTWHTVATARILFEGHS